MGEHRGKQQIEELLQPALGRVHHCGLVETRVRKCDDQDAADTRKLAPTTNCQETLGDVAKATNLCA